MNSRAASTRSIRKRQAKIRSQLEESVSDREDIMISFLLRTFPVQRSVARRSETMEELFFPFLLEYYGCVCQSDYLMAATCDKYLASYQHCLFLPEVLERALLADHSSLPGRKLFMICVRE